MGRHLVADLQCRKMLPDTCNLIKKETITACILHEGPRTIQCWPEPVLGSNLEPWHEMNMSHWPHHSKRQPYVGDFLDETFIGVHRNSSKAYTTLVWPTLEYPSPVWDPHEKTNIDKPEKVQRSAARVVFDQSRRCTAGNQESVTALISELGWPSLVETWQRSTGFHV